MTEEYSRTEKLRAKALRDWFRLDDKRNDCLRISSRLISTQENLKYYAQTVSIHAPELSKRFKDVRREIYAIAKELEKKGKEKDHDMTRYYRMAIADDPKEVQMTDTAGNAHPTDKKEER